MAGIVQPAPQSPRMEGLAARERERRGWRSIARLLACACLLLSLAAPAAADTHLIQLDNATSEVPLADAGEVWLDPTGQAIVDNVATAAGLPWRRTREGEIHPLRTGQSLWFRFEVAAMDDAERWYLEVPYPAVDLVTLYAPDRLGQWSPLSAGDSLPVAQWPLPKKGAA